MSDPGLFPLLPENFFFICETSLPRPPFFLCSSLFLYLRSEPIGLLVWQWETESGGKEECFFSLLLSFFLRLTTAGSEKFQTHMKSSPGSHAVLIWRLSSGLARQHTVRMRWWTLEKSSSPLCLPPLPVGWVPMLPGVTQHPIKGDLSLRAGRLQTPRALLLTFAPVITF